MDKKLPGIYANKVGGNIGNNKQVFYSNDREIGDRGSETMTKIEKNINQKINEIFNSTNYIYKADVELRLKSGTVNKRIVGKNAVHLITIENELIPIADILDIKRK